MSKLRVIVGAGGLGLALFGVYRLLTEIPLVDLRWLAVWLVAALVLHDGVLAPATIVAAAVLEGTMRPRARRYVQGALVAGVGVTVIAIPLIMRKNTQAPAKALLRQNYAVHLGWLWLAIGACAGLLYLVRVVRDVRSRD